MTIKLSFIADVIRNEVLFTNIKCDVSVINLCNFYKFNDIDINTSVFILLGLCFTFFTRTSAKFDLKMDFAFVMYFVMIGNLGKSLLLTISLYPRSEG